MTPVGELRPETQYMTLRSGASGRFPVFFTVPNPGLYIIEFDVRLSNEELEIHEAVAKDAARVRKAEIVWNGNTVLVVR